MGDSWQELGTVAPESLVDARLQLHHAAQLAAALGATLLEPQPDDSHPNLGWHAATQALVGHPTPHPRPLRGGLALAPLRLQLLDAEARPLASLDLDGQRWEQARSWLEAAAAEHLPPVEASPWLKAPGYELPAHPVAGESAFRRSPASAFEELARAYADAALELGALAAGDPAASPLRCWPHHFDLATLIGLDPEIADPEAARSIGAGFSPGDESYDAPYFYVSPWPRPGEDRPLPPLEGGGHWHREGFVGAVLPLGRLIAAGGARAQQECCRRFLGSSVAACRQLLA